VVVLDVGIWVEALCARAAEDFSHGSDGDKLGQSLVNRCPTDLGKLGLG
jgi:hypothetical protein